MKSNLITDRNQSYKIYSTNAQHLNNQSCHRFYSTISQHASSTQKFKVCNMNDEQRRIKRQQNLLYSQSNLQSKLFQKGVKKIRPTVDQNAKRQSSLKRQYHNKQTYDILNPIPKSQNRLISGGVRKIYLYNQIKQSNKSRQFSGSRKKFVQQLNKQSQQKNSSPLYLVKKIMTHKNCANQWHNQMTAVQFKKKQNVANKQRIQNDETKQAAEHRNGKQLSQNIKNKSIFVNSQSGITLRQNKQATNKIDFTKNYYTKQSKSNINLRI